MPWTINKGTLEYLLLSRMKAKTLPWVLRTKPPRVGGTPILTATGSPARWKSLQSRSLCSLWPARTTWKCASWAWLRLGWRGNAELRFSKVNSKKPGKPTEVGPMSGLRQGRGNEAFNSAMKNQLSGVFLNFDENAFWPNNFWTWWKYNNIIPLETYYSLSVFHWNVLILSYEAMSTFSILFIQAFIVVKFREGRSKDPKKSADSNQRKLFR